METSMLNGMCRCCASEGVFKDVKTSYTWMGEEEVYADMLRECFDINLSSSEHGEDGGICEVCITQLRNASNFKKQVLTTEEQFKKLALNKLFKPNIVKVEVSADDANDSDDNLSAEEAYSGPEFDVPIKTEAEEPKPKKRAAAKASTSRAKKAKTDNGEPSTKRDEEESDENDETETDNSLQKNKTALSSIKQSRDEVKKNMNNIIKILMYTNATPILRKEDVGYYCFFCVSYYPDPANLKKHNLEGHTGNRGLLYNKRRVKKDQRRCIKVDITGLRCTLCNKDINTLELMFEHLKNEHKKIIYTDVKNLIMPFKFDSDTLRCCICSNVFEKFKKLMEHMHNHYRNYVCEICDLGFVTREGLVKHSHSHKVGNFKCSHCNKTFNTDQKRKYHEKFAHMQDTMKYKCGYCNERFMESRHKDEHLSTLHGVVFNFKCRACDKTFRSRSSLTVHTKRDHLMERKYKCVQCDMKFFSPSELKMHGLKHSGIKEFQCDICSKSYGRKKTLKEHMRIHNDERRFKCEHCGQAFIQKCSWKSHMKNKHGEIVK